MLLRSPTAAMRVQRTFLAGACAAQPRTAFRTSALAASSSARMSTTIAAVEQGENKGGMGGGTGFVVGKMIF